MTERDAATSALAGPLVNAGATSRRAGALRADARQEQDGPREQPPGLADRARMRRADDRADARQAALADEVLAPLRDEARHVLPERLPVREREILDVRHALVRRLDEAEDARPFAPAGGDERLERVEAEIRVDGHRVGDRRPALAGFQVGGGIGPRRRADVSALRVGDDDQAGRARVRANVLERLHPGRAERLEEGELRLHADRVRGDRVDHAAAEAGAGVGCLAAAEPGLARELERQQLRHRVEPDEELAPLALDGFGEPDRRTSGSTLRHVAHRRDAHSTAALRPSRTLET